MRIVFYYLIPYRTQKHYIIDGDKHNNDISKLYLTIVAEHNKLHAESESIIFELVKKGIVKFNREIGRYELT